MPLGTVFRRSESRPRFAEPTNKPDTQLVLSLLALKHDFRKLPVQPHPSILKTLHSVAGKDKILRTINDKFITRSKTRKPMPGATKDVLRFMAGSPKKNGLVFDNKANELQGENTPIQVHRNPNYVLVYRSPRSKRIARIENPPWFLANYALSVWLQKKHRTITNALQKLRYDDLDLDERKWKNENGYQVLSLPTPKGHVPKKPEGPFTHLYHYASRPIPNARKGVLVKTSNQIYTHTYPFWKWGTNSSMRVRIKIPTSVLQKATHSYGGAAPKGLQKTSMYPIGSAYRANGERFGTIILPGFWGTINDISNDGLEVEITYLGERGGSLRSVRSSPSPKPNSPKPNSPKPNSPKPNSPKPNGPRGKRQKTTSQ